MWTMFPPPPFPSLAAAVNSPIAESEHHNFRYRTLRPQRYFFCVSFVRRGACDKGRDNCKALYAVEPIVFACVSRTNDYVRNCGGYCCERRLISAVV